VDGDVLTLEPLSAGAAARSSTSALEPAICRDPRPVLAFTRAISLALTAT
jgi:hypothetical protein